MHLDLGKYEVVVISSPLLFNVNNTFDEID